MVFKSFIKKDPSPYRVHIDDYKVTDNFADRLLDLLPINQPKKDIVIVCIGTDRSTGDCLGPLIGEKLIHKNLSCFHVFGTLENPVHAVNLQETITAILHTFEDPFVIGVDACLGKSSSVGFISLANGPVKPGAAVNKDLPEIGNINITGIVNVGGFMEYMVLQNTRLHLVMKMADIISDSIYIADKKYGRQTDRSLARAFKENFFSS